VTGERDRPRRTEPRVRPSSNKERAILPWPTRTLRGLRGCAPPALRASSRSTGTRAARSPTRPVLEMWAAARARVWDSGFYRPRRVKPTRQKNVIASCRSTCKFDLRQLGN